MFVRFLLFLFFAQGQERLAIIISTVSLERTSSYMSPILFFSAKKSKVHIIEIYDQVFIVPWSVLLAFYP